MIKVSIDATLGIARVKKLKEFFTSEDLLNIVRYRVLAWVNENISKEGIETHWRPLSFLTLLLKGDHSAKPLQSFGKSVTSRIEGNNTVWVGWPAERQRLAKIHHSGTRPYTITVKNAKVLAARVPGGGRNWIVFGPIVHHPGIPARPLVPSGTYARKMIIETLNKAIAKAVKEA